MSKRLTTRFAALFAATGLALAMTACSSGEESGDEGNADGGNQEETQDEEEGSDEEPFGAACADVPADGDGSFEGMAQDPVATAAGNNEELTTLVDAVGEADLVDTLNSEEDITVFAPANSAFEEIPEEDLTALMEDKEGLTDVLTYHVVGERISPDQLGSEGPFTTLQGDDLEASGSGEDFTIGEQEAGVACGNVQTANATVYIIDTVLMPAE